MSEEEKEEEVDQTEAQSTKAGDALQRAVAQVLWDHVLTLRPRKAFDELQDALRAYTRAKGLNGETATVVEGEEDE